MTDNQLDFLDLLNIMSFVIGIMNYNENLTQGDKQDLLSALNEQTNILLEETHKHLESQDKKIDYIMEVLHEKNKETGQKY